jgi:hypothetical protein
MTVYKTIELRGVVNWECDLSSMKHGEGIAKWFVIKLGLCKEGIDIYKKLDDMHATLVECEVVWGKKKKS